MEANLIIKQVLTQFMDCNKCYFGTWQYSALYCLFCPTQAAYRVGRGTTEQLSILKMMAEKAVRSTNFDTHILLMDLSRAFDTVNRKIPLQDLCGILDPGELHTINILIEDVRLIVDVELRRAEPLTTNVGTP